MLFQDITITFISAFLIIIVTFLYIGIKTLKWNPSNRTNQIFAIFFFVTTIALSINIPAPFMPQSIRIILVTTTAYGVSVSIGIMVVFTLVLHFSNKIITDKRKWAIICLFALIFCVYFFFPINIVEINGIYMTRYSPELAIYFLVGTQIEYFLSIWFAVKVYKNFKDVTMKKRFRYFLLGLGCFEVMLIITPLVNAGWVPTIMQFLLFFALPGAILVYLGVGKTL